MMRPRPTMGSWLPRGRTLSDEAWEQRHRWMVWLLWLNALGIFAFALMQGYVLGHALLDAGGIIAFAVLAVVKRRDRRVGSVSAAIGLLTASAIAVHLSHGAIEAHFHFFVVIAVLTLYEDWLPFLVAAGYVLLHHGVVGVLAPESVFAHDAAAGHPWRWAAIHAAFVSAAGAANVLAWRLHEDTRAHMQREQRRLTEAEKIGRMGSWEWDAGTGELVGSEQLRRLFDLPPGEDITFEAFAAVVHPDDRPRTVGHLSRAAELGRFDALEYRIVDRDGDVRHVLSRGEISFGPSGEIERMTGTSVDITERKLAEDAIRDSREALAHQALHDALTGLPNRTLLQDRLEHALRRSGRDGSRVALLFLDIDRFKLVNDSLGHAAGDELLVRIAARLDEVLRPSDTLARFGGDELAILCEDVEHERDAAAVAERAVAALAVPLEVAGREVFATASVGVAIATPGDSAGALLRDADSAMYRAKELGGARYELFDTALRSRLVERMQTEDELRAAIHRGQLRLHFQPVVSLGDGVLTGAEALVRWEHPERGLLAPGEFIPVAEESSLIVTLGTWVLRAACEQLAAWEPMLPEGFAVAVNVSARQFADPRMVDSVRSALDAAGVPAHRLSLELTESVLMQQDGAGDALSALKELGVRVVMDDFGTGYSSLGYLSRFTLDGLKVDRSFVARMSEGSPEQAIIAAVGTMAAAMDLHVVAEGIETDDQRAELDRLGYRFGQGFLFARPMDSGAFAAVLERTGAGQPAAGSKP